VDGRRIASVVKLRQPAAFAPASWLGDNAVAGGGVAQSALTLHIEDAPPRLYVVPVAGSWPGLGALTVPRGSELLELRAAEESGCAVDRLPGDQPAWVVDGPGGAALDLALEGIVAGPTEGAGHVAVYGVGGERGDSADLVSVRFVTAAVKIETFDVTPATIANIDAPTPIAVTWKVQNASAVTLSGFGVVADEGKDLQLFVEQTTTLVLTAYDSAFHTIVSEQRTVEVAPALASRMVPAGTIMAWSGSTTDIPDGWALCDSQNGTPDLRDRFVVGAGGAEAPHKMGDADAHTHTIKKLQRGFNTSWAGDHTHGFPSKWYGRSFGGGVSTGIDTNGGFNPNDQTQSAGSHSHYVDISFESFESAPNSGGIRPPWYALCYIMKLAWPQ
jgi:hypothetical protein